MAYVAGSVVVDIIAKADAVRKAFKQAKDSVNDFGSQVTTTDKSIRSLGQTIATSLAEPKSVFSWVNSLNDTLKNIDYVAGKGFVSTGKSAKQLAQDAKRASEDIADAQVKLAQKTEEAQKRVREAQSSMASTGTSLTQATQARQMAEITAMETNKAKVVKQAETEYRDAMEKSAQASDKAYLATLKHMQLNSGATKVAKDEADARLKLAQANETEARSNLNAIKNANPSIIPNTLGKSDSSVQNLRNAQATETQATSAQKAAQADLKLAQANLQQATSAQSATGAMNSNSEAANRNANAKKNMADNTHKAHMADLDLIFAAMYAQVALAGIISSLENMTKKGLEARNALTGLEAVVRANGQDVSEAKEIFASFKQDGLMSDADIGTSMKNLALVGYSLEDSAKMIDRFKDSAAFGKQASLGFGEAIVKTTEGVRLGLSTLSDGAGMAKNLGQILKENGYTEKDLSKISTDAGVRQALFNGIMKETAYAVGDANTLSKDLGGTLARLKTAGNDLNTSVLSAMSGLLNSIASALIPLIRSMKAWVDEHPRLTAVIITTTVVLLTLVTVMLSFQFLFPMIVKGFKQIGLILGFVTTPIGIVIAAIMLLGIIFVTNKDMILDTCSDLVNGWGEYFSSIWRYTKDFCSDMGSMFGGLGKIIAGAMAFDMDTVQAGIDQVKAGWYNGVQELHAAGRATATVVTTTIDEVVNNLNPVTLFGNAWGKVKSIFDPVTIDLSNKQQRPPSDDEDDDDDGKKKKTPKEKAGQSPYQIAMKEYEHKVHMEELVDYDDKINALAEIANTVEMTYDEQMDYEEKVHDLIKEHTEDEKKYATELMDFQIKTGEKTYEDKIKLLDEQINAESDRHKKLQLQEQKLQSQDQLKQYDKDYMDYEIDIGKKTLSDKLNQINTELLAEKDKFKKLKLLKEQYQTESKMNEENATKEIKAKTDILNIKSASGEYNNLGSVDIKKLMRDLQELAQKYERMGTVGKEAANKVKEAIKDLQAVTDQWVDKFVDGLAEVVTGGQKLGQFFDKMMSDIAMSFVKYQLNRLLGGALGGLFQGMPWLYGKKHDGGQITKFHTGGIIGGLESDERVIVGQTGERVLNRRETKAFEAALQMKGSKPSTTNQYYISAMDAQSFSEFAYKNRSAIGGAAAQDIMDGGAMTKAMRMVR